MEEKSPFPLDELKFTLEERRDFIKEHDAEMEYICSSLKHYLDDVEHAISLEFSHSVVSHLTYNMVLTLANGLTYLTIFEYVKGAYMLDDDYDTTYEVWKSVYDSANSIIPLLAKLEEENYFENDINVEDFLADIIVPQCKMAQGYERILNLYRRVALKSSNSLVYSLNYSLRFMERLLSNMKIGKYDVLNEEYDRVYLANYRLYKKCFWPLDGRHFRAHIERQKPRYEKITPDFLERMLWVEKKDFENTPTGIIWRDFFEDKKDLYFEAKRIRLNEEQWKYFFKNICRFEEYENWIDELRNTPSKGEEAFIQDATGDNTQGDAKQKIAAFFNDGILKIEEPSLLYFLLLAMWARHMLPNKEIPAFVRTVGEAYPALFEYEGSQGKIIISLQNMNKKANQYFDVFIKDQATMKAYIDLMYPKKKNGKRRKDCQRAVELADKLFLGLK